ncbi:unnamed protein product [Meganyctiphanes norvegica]|uniref:Uncharacterized protein n=1 Tax=Meganyctiphanes norvegica TaxID=48144 RepID=A0AAV2PW64_MEGNR
MKIISLCLASLVALSAGAPAKLGGEEALAQVIRDDSIAPVGAIYSTDVETDNGIRISEQGSAGSAGQSNQQGSYSYVAPDGTNVEVSYLCDELGCQYQSPFLPVAPAAPPHVAELLAIAAEQRAAGITFV